MKQCCTCKKELSIDCFYKCSTRKDGYSPNCKQCHRKITLNSYKKRMQERHTLLHSLKINGCAICGYNKCDDALCFHHTNPKDKNFTFGNEFFKHSEKDAVAELNKCILLCRNCHAEIHYKEKLMEVMR